MQEQPLYGIISHNRISIAKVEIRLRLLTAADAPGGVVNMAKITYNSDIDVVNKVKEGLKRTGGYCPCRLERSEDNKCMCREFREQIKDPEFEGFCHCMLYYKSKE